MCIMVMKYLYFSLESLTRHLSLFTSQMHGGVLICSYYEEVKIVSLSRPKSEILGSMLGIRGCCQLQILWAYFFPWASCLLVSGKEMKSPSFLHWRREISNKTNKVNDCSALNLVPPPFNWFGLKVTLCVRKALRTGILHDHHGFYSLGLTRPKILGLHPIMALKLSQRPI